MRALAGRPNTVLRVCPLHSDAQKTQVHFSSKKRLIESVTFDTTKPRGCTWIRKKEFLAEITKSVFFKLDEDERLGFAWYLTNAVRSDMMSSD